MQRTAYATAAGVVVAASGFAWLLSRLLVEPANLVMVFLLAVTYVAVRFGAGPSALSALLGVAMLDFFFVEPHLTFAVKDTQYVLTFLVMLAVGLVISRLATQARQQAETARERERHTALLYSLSHELARAAGTDEIVRHAARHIAKLLDARVALFLPGSRGSLDLRAAIEAPFADSANERAVAQWVQDHGRPAGAGTETLPGSRASYLPLAAHRGPVGVLAVSTKAGVGIDPTRRAQLEAFADQVALAIERAQLVEAAQQAEVEAESERLRSSLLASVSHDLRTPLATIRGSAAAILEPHCDPATRLDLAESIRAESQRLGGYVDKLLAMTRLETGSLHLDKEWQPIEDTIGSALARIEPELGGRNVRLDVPGDLPLAPFDAVLIEQVLVNLLENACRYTDEKAEIEVRARPEASGLVVEVADTGPGLAPGSEKRIFEKFHRESSRGTGAGLGLAICMAIVLAHGGTMWAVNRPEGGAAFSFVIPIEGTPPAPPPEETEQGT